MFLRGPIKIIKPRLTAWESKLPLSSKWKLAVADYDITPVKNHVININRHIFPYDHGQHFLSTNCQSLLYHKTKILQWYILSELNIIFCTNLPIKNSFGIAPPAYMEDIPRYVEFARHTRYAERLTIVL